MGRTVYSPTWKVDLYGLHAGKYTSPMDPMGNNQIALTLSQNRLFLFLFKHMERLVELQRDHSGFLMVESYC